MSQSAAKKILESVFHGSGAFALARRLRRPGCLRILMYHRFPAEDLLIRQCDYLRRNYQIVSMAQVSCWLHENEPLPERPLAITIDDGHADFHEIAFPVFQRYSFPVTLYVVSEFVGGKIWLWPDQVSYLCRQANPRQFQIRLGESELPLDFSTQAARSASTSLLKQKLKTASNAQRVDAMERLPEALGIELPAQPPSAFRPVAWQQLREMQETGFLTVGSHTARHPILSRLESEEEIEREIAESNAAIERECGQRPDHFCYPNGDYDQRILSVLARLSVRTAVTTERGTNERGTNPYLIKRLGVDPTDPFFYFQRQVAAL